MTKNVITVAPNERFPEILKLMVRKRISGLPVVNIKGKVVGIISEKDLFFRLFPSQKDFYKNLEYYMNLEKVEDVARGIIKLRARNLMSKDIISVSSDDNILKACSLSLIHNVRRLPVIDKGKLVGIITTNNIYKNFMLSLIKKKS